MWTKAATKSAKLKIVPPFVSGYKCINYSRKLKKNVDMISGTYILTG